MPVNPDISLQVAVPQVGGAGSPLDTLSRFATIQNALNQNRLFQQTFAARQAAGQIIAAAPDLDTGLANLFKDPATAAFAPEMVNTARQMQSTMADIATKKQALAQSGLAFTLKNMAGALADPSMLENSMNVGLATVDPLVAPEVRSAMASVVKGLGQGLPSDPVAARQQYQARMVGMLLGAGHTPESLRGITGTMAPGVQWEPVGSGGALAPVVVGSSIAGGIPNVSLQTQAGGAGPITGLTPEQSEASAGAGKAAGEISSDMASRMQLLPTAINRINLMTDALGQFQAGGGADFRAQLAKGLQALQHMGLPISNETINSVGNSDLAATQVFNSQVKPYVIGQLKEVAQGTGRVMRSEVDAFIGSLNATTDPKAIMEILNLARKSLQIGYDQAQRFTEYRQMLASGDPRVKGLGPSDFYSYYYKHPEPLQSPPMADLGPVPLANAMGVAPAKQWIFKNGKLVPAEGAAK